MNQVRLEQAIVELKDAMHSVPTVEFAFQQLFEKWPELLLALGYDNHHPKPRLNTGPNEWLEPDFLAVRDESLGEIVELKTPGEPIFKGISNRPTCYHRINEYLGQVEEYIKWFDDPAKRDDIFRRYGIRTAREPNALLIVGRAGDMEQSKLHDLRQSRRLPIRVATFDDVLAAIERHRYLNFGVGENAAGCSIYFAVRIYPSQSRARQCLVEIGADVNRNHLAVWVDHSGHLHVEVADIESGRIECCAAKPFPAVSEEWQRIGIEFGSDARGTTLRVFLNGQLTCSSVVPETLRIDAESPTVKWTISASSTNTDHADLDWARIYIFSRMLTFVERLDVDDYFSKRSKPDKWIEFRNGAAMSRGGPNSDFLVPEGWVAPIYRASST